MEIVLTVRAIVSFQSGKFASREAIAQAIADELQDPGTVDADEGEYNVDDWEVEIQ